MRLFLLRASLLGGSGEVLKKSEHVWGLPRNPQSWNELVERVEEATVTFELLIVKKCYQISFIFIGTTKDFKSVIIW